MSNFQQSGLAAKFRFQTGDSTHCFVSKHGTHIVVGTRGVMVMAILRAESD